MTSVQENTANTTQTFNFGFEYNVIFYSGEKRWSKPIEEVDDVRQLCKQFASVELIALEAEILQTTLIGATATTLHPGGAVFVGIIPTSKDSDTHTGGAASNILSVPRKNAFPLSSHEQTVRTFVQNLSGYELDLAQDPRRGQGPVMWCGNTGVRRIVASGTTTSQTELPIIAMTWRIKVACTGQSTLW